MADVTRPGCGVFATSPVLRMSRDQMTTVTTAGASLPFLVPDGCDIRLDWRIVDLQGLSAIGCPGRQRDDAEGYDDVKRHEVDGHESRLLISGLRPMCLAAAMPGDALALPGVSHWGESVSVDRSSHLSRGQRATSEAV